MNEKIGVFICRCSDNISGVVDTDELKKQVEPCHGVEFVECHDLLCSPAGKEFLSEQMREHGAGRAVIAACSPKDHEAGFQKCLEQAGVNKYLLQMANIREHCTWVTRDENAAFDKSLSMVKAAIGRVKHHEALEEQEIDCCADVVVIGGGIAGMEAALLAAQGGRKVTLVEAGPSIGGRVTAYEDVAPNMECAPCMLAPRMNEVQENENIEIITNAHADRILGFLGNFKVHIEKRARKVIEEACLGCDECIQVCPVSVADPYQQGLGDRKAIYVPFPGSVPNCAVIDPAACSRTSGEECTACAEACPLEALDFEQEDEQLEITAGAIVVATGFKSFDPTPLESLGFGRLPEVYTLDQFERLTSNHGPTGGKILKSNGEPPEKIAVIHCVGREELGYCSGVCCEASMKVDWVVNHGEDDEEHEGSPAEVVHLHREIVAPGPLSARMLARVSDGESHFIGIGDPSSTRVSSGENGLVIEYVDAGGEAGVVNADMVLLATGMCPSPGTEELAEKLSLVCDDSGFPAPDHPLLRPAQSSIDGVYLAGCAGGPKNIRDSIAQAQAAAGSALARLQPGKKLTLEVITAHAKEELCSRCLVCVAVCPYQACVFYPESDRVAVNEALCHGCGTCVAACASGVAEARHFTDEQICTEITEVLHG